MKAFLRRHVHIICAMVVGEAITIAFFLPDRWYWAFPLGIVLGAISGQLKARDVRRQSRG